MWTCENSTKTFNTLVAALTFGKLASKTKVSDIKSGFKNQKRGRNNQLRNQARGDSPSLVSTSCPLKNSFLAGTEVLTPDGLVNIEDIKVGDWVIADDPETPGEVIPKQVLDTFSSTNDSGIYDISIDDEVISSTHEHPFWVVDKELVSAENLKLGDWIVEDNPDTEDIIESKQILAIDIKEDGSYELNLEGELVSIEETDEFWIRDDKWVDAKDLEAGDLLQTDEGSLLSVNGIEYREGSFEVFNFEVEDFHTYFVSQDGVLVHNVSCKLQADTRQPGEHIVFKFDNETGEVRSYATYIPQTNPQNPNPWEEVQRVDLQGAAHHNKKYKVDIPTPHVNSHNIPGKVRPAYPHEVPNKYKQKASDNLYSLFMDGIVF